MTQVLVRELFETFNAFLDNQGYVAQKGQIIDASIVAAPRQRNSRQENEQIKAGETPEAWADKPHKRSQKDIDASWTKKHGKTYYGYKNHINVDNKHRLIREYDITTASTHDSRLLTELIDLSNSGKSIWADSAYSSEDLSALSAQLTKITVEAALKAEMETHLGYASHDTKGHNSGNTQGGTP